MSATHKNEIIERFSIKITDYSLLNMVVGARENLHMSFLKSAIAKFTCCTKPLLISDDGFFYGENSDGTVYDVELNNEEVEILASLMAVQWVDKILLDRTVLQQHFGTKEIKLNSPAQHMKELNSIRDYYNGEASDLMANYQYKVSKYGPSTS